MDNEISSEKLQHLIETMPDYAMVVLDLAGLLTGGENGDE